MPSPHRIDVHFHVIPQFYADAVYAAGSGPALGRYPDWSLELALEVMDQFGIATALTSLAQPGVHLHDYGKSARAGRKLGHCTLLAPTDGRHRLPPIPFGLGTDL